MEAEVWEKRKGWVFWVEGAGVGRITQSLQTMSHVTEKPGPP